MDKQKASRLLAILGPRIGWLRVIPRRQRVASERSGVWYRLSHTIMRQPLTFLTAGLGLLLVLAIPVLDIGLMGVAPGSLLKDIPAGKAEKGIQDLLKRFGK